MLIIEGADLVGKTTLAKALLKRAELDDRGYIYGHMGVLPSGFSAEQYIDLAQPWLVQDRFHMSQIVYRFIENQPDHFLTPDVYRMIDGALRMFGTFTIIMTASLELLAQRYEERGDGLYNLTNINLANACFRDLATHHPFGLSCYKVDVDVHVHSQSSHLEPTPEIVDSILGRYFQRMEIARTLNTDTQNADFS